MVIARRTAVPKVRNASNEHGKGIKQNDKR